ncbi:hypothetical protein [Streptomyces sp. NPDC016675]|jgi:catechol 2,3-dioxygenase-like lactoylglutathione lyase family enzyme|uniref:hypothetical protein n=1 Tax=Streptomyces sp. NPDC016675 TaxID=3364970 RepID=UPI0036F84866
MPDLLGINHLTLSTTDLDRLLPYYTELLGGVLAFERAATGSAPGSRSGGSGPCPRSGP